MNKQILLINLPSHEHYDQEIRNVLFPATGLLLIGNSLKKAGYDIDFVDGVYHEDYENIVLNKCKDGYLFIGLSLMTVQLSFATRLSVKIKEKYPNEVVVWGGIHPTLFPEEIGSLTYVDYVVVNEATKSVVKLADVLSLQSGHQKERIIRQSEPDNIEAAENLDYEIINIKNYLNSSYFFDGLQKTISLPVFTGFGCSYKCRFCLNEMLCRRHRLMPALTIVNQIERLMKEYNANSFLFQDEDFFSNKERIYEFANLVEERRLKFNWLTWVRTNYFNSNYLNVEMCKRLKTIGLYEFYMGVESGSPDVMKRLNKNCDNVHAIRAAEYIVQANIRQKCSFMIGFNFETRSDLRKTMRLAMKIKEVNNKADVAIFLYIPYPGNEFYDECSSWINKKRRYYEIVLFYFNIFSVTFSGRISSKPIIRDIIRLVVKMRVNLGFYKFPIECYLFKYIDSLKKKIKEKRKR